MFEVLVGLMIVCVILLFIYQVSKGTNEFIENNNAPVETVRAKVAAKRTRVEQHHNMVGDTVQMQVNTTYYVTFELASGQRKEFTMRGREYGLLAEGDAGILTFQRNRYHGFERNRRQV